MQASLIDTHCHLDFSDFDHDRSEIIRESKQSKVSDIIVPAVARGNWEAVKKLTESKDGLHGAYGLHPCFLSEHSIQDLDALGHWLKHNTAIAVGECGLDYRDKNTDRDFQRQLLIGQLALADIYDLPVILHAVKAVADVIHLIKKYPKVRGVMHSYSGSIEQAEILYQNGYYFGIGGPVSWGNAPKIKRVVANLPLDAMVLESDAPDQSPQKHRGERNQPAWIVYIVQEIAQLHNISETEVAKLTTENARHLFKI